MVNEIHSIKGESTEVYRKLNLEKPVTVLDPNNPVLEVCRRIVN